MNIILGTEYFILLDRPTRQFNITVESASVNHQTGSNHVTGFIGPDTGVTAHHSNIRLPPPSRYQCLCWADPMAGLWMGNIDYYDLIEAKKNRRMAPK